MLFRWYLLLARNKTFAILWLPENRIKAIEWEFGECPLLFAMNVFLDIPIPRSFVIIWLVEMLSQQKAKHDVFL